MHSEGTMEKEAENRAPWDQQIDRRQQSWPPPVPAPAPHAQLL